MDDPNLAWPAWKFGMKRDDLFTTLHDKYNTFTNTIQDPEAFHHDVYEISHDAETVDEFHRMMADRQRMRFRELNETLETLAVEIIANPKLIGSEQWQHALQLFRTKSYDSIVRYFASYLPDDYLDRHDIQSTSSSSFSETDSLSTTASSVDDAPFPFIDDDFFPNGPIMTAEPCSIKPDAYVASKPEAPLSPPHSEAEQSEPSVSSPSDSESHTYSTPSRSMSFSGSESGQSVPEAFRRRYLERDFDETSQSDDCDTAITSLCDSMESPSALDVDAHTHHTKLEACEPLDFGDDEEFPPAQYPIDEFDYLDCLDVTNTHDTLDSDTPTPRPEAGATASYLDFRSIISKNTPSPYRRSPSPKSHMGSRGAASPSREVRRSPEESLCKVQKPVLDLTKKRPKARRRVD